MTDDDYKHSQEVQRQRAQKDLEDINTLRNSESFQRYFVRRLTERHDKLAVDFKYEKVSHEEREVLRRLVLEYEQEIAQLMAKDELACRAVLTISQPSKILHGGPGNS